MLTRLTPKSEFNKNVFTLMTGTTIAQAIPIAISPILTRIYTPEDFGIFALFVSIVGFISVIAALTYEQAIFIPKYDKYAINIFALSLIIIVLITLISFIIIFMFKDNILYILKDKTIDDLLYVVPFTVFFISLFNLLSNYNNRIKNYKDIAKATVIKSIALSIVQIIIGICQNGPSGLIIGQISAQIFANIKLLKNITKDKVLLGFISMSRIIFVLKKYKNFPKYHMPHALLNTISASLPIYFFIPFFGPEVVGFYSLALMITLTPMMVIAGSMAKVYNQKISEIYNDKLDAYAFTIDIIKSLVRKLLIPFLVFVIFAPDIVGIIFGKKWEQTGLYIQILSVFIFLNVVVSIIAYIVNLKNLQKKAFIISIIHFLLLLLWLYYLGIQGNIIHTLIGLSIINSIVLIYNFIWLTNSLKEKK